MKKRRDVTPPVNTVDDARRFVEKLAAPLEAIQRQLGWAARLHAPTPDNGLGNHKQGAAWWLIGRSHLEATALETFVEIDKDERSEWEGLVREVLKDDNRFRERFALKFQVNEFRPRTFFSTLPGSALWGKVDASSDRNAGLLECKVRLFGRLGGVQAKRLSVLLPVCNGYRRTFRSLACLMYDIERMRRDFALSFHVCVNFSDDNSIHEVMRFANTVALKYDVPVVLYSVEHSRARGRGGRGAEDQQSESQVVNDWNKTAMLNLMLQHIAQQHYPRGVGTAESRTNHFLHFADDDIYIRSGDDVIPFLVDRLSEAGGPSIVSAACYDSASSGFAALASVRKRRAAVKGAEEARLLNLYGGCMTTTYEYLYQICPHNRNIPTLPTQVSEGERFGEDSYLTMVANKEIIYDCQEPKALQAYATTEKIVGHPEERDVLSWAQRHLRDREWSESSARAASGTEREDEVTKFVKCFKKLRQSSFDPVSNAIESGAVREQIAQKWQRRLRTKIQTSRKDFLGAIRNCVTTEWKNSKTQHQLCLAIAFDKDVQRSIYRALRPDAVSCRAVMRMLKRLAAGDWDVFPKLCKALVALPKDVVDRIRLRDAHLWHLHAIAVECFENIAACKRKWGGTNTAKGLLLGLPKRLRKELASGGESRVQELFASDEHLPRWLSPESIKFRPIAESRAGIPTFVRPKKSQESTGRESVFVRYFPVIGTKALTHESPRRLIYLHVLGENILRTAIAAADSARPVGGDANGPLLPEIELVRTLRPKLREAMIAYSGPERVDAKSRFLNAVYFQDGLLRSATPVSGERLSQCGLIQLSVGLGSFLGRLHGITLGIRRFLHQRVSNPSFGMHAVPPFSEITDLLTEHMDQIRLFMPAVYRKWLRNGAAWPRSIKQLMARLKSKKRRNGILDHVRQLVRLDGISIRDVWYDLCDDSERFHEDCGAIGRMGSTKPDYFISLSKRAQDPSEIEKVFFARHFGVAMVDPAIDAGNTLAELMAIRVRGAMAAYAQDHDGNEDELAPSNMHDDSLPEIRRAFCTSYKEHLTIAKDSPLLGSAKTDEKSLDGIISGIMLRKSRMAAIAFLAQNQSFHEVSLGTKNEEKIIHMCVDLLHTGAPAGLRFRNDAHHPLS